MKIDIKSENGTAVAKLSGEIDHHNARELRAQLDKYIITAQPRELAMDFGNITFMDSSGIGLVMGRYKAVKAYSGVVIIENTGSQIKKVILFIK